MNTLFISGLSVRVRARELAYEFERYGRLRRCDIPAPKGRFTKCFAFVEFEDPRDAEDAYRAMHGRIIDGYEICVEWAKTGSNGGRGQDRGRRDEMDRRPRSPPPRRRSRSPRNHGAYRPDEKLDKREYSSQRHRAPSVSPPRRRDPPSRLREDDDEERRRRRADEDDDRSTFSPTKSDR